MNAQQLMQPKYRLVAIDLDDTLLNKDLKISPRTKANIIAARQLGTQITLATGRMFRSALPYAEQLGLDIPLITYQGALVKNSSSGEVLYHRPVPPELVRPVAERVRSYGYHLQMYFEDHLCMEKLTPEGQDYVDLAGVEVTLVSDLLCACPEPTKILISNYDEGRLDRLAEVLQAEFGQKLYITKSKPYYLELLHPEATKGKALKVLADHFGIPQEAVIAIGDSFNDVDMIRFAGVGVVMGNAREEIKAEADYVTRSNEDDGVAEVLEKFILGKGPAEREWGAGAERAANSLSF
jgi:Cof subfamily protein (haloacid dehalogenase superfamily)